MPNRCLLYYITDRAQFPGTEPERRARLLQKIKQAAQAAVDYIQLREKDLPTRELEFLAREAVAEVRKNSHPDHPTLILINSRTDVAIVAEADGVHLRSDDIASNEVHRIWSSAHAQGVCRGRPRPVIAISCHSSADVQSAQQNSADFAVFAPVFEKKKPPAPSAGLEALRQACQYKIPVLALGGITADNAVACLEAGAAGIAAIRLFQENDIQKVIARLRG